ncbi:hypothetical protein ANAPC5_01341 [Anaplasma phagocytophilum]|nr:hypothetical protein ANAPC5_01341 [Anaplasma phagocytophilum]
MSNHLTFSTTPSRKLPLSGVNVTTDEVRDFEREREEREGQKKPGQNIGGGNGVFRPVVYASEAGSGGFVPSTSAPGRHSRGGTRGEGHHIDPAQKGPQPSGTK